jgi:hypothetical protein
MRGPRRHRFLNHLSQGSVNACRATSLLLKSTELVSVSAGLNLNVLVVFESMSFFVGAH